MHCLDFQISHVKVQEGVMMAKKETISIYDDEMFFNSYIELRSRPDNYNDLIEQPNILELIGDISGKKVLDIGCGFGTLTVALSKKNPMRVLGIDNSARMLEEAEKQNKPANVEYRLIDANDIDTISEKFDVVCSSLTFHYIKNISFLFQKIMNLMNENGRLIFSQEHPILTAGEMGVVVSDLSEGINIKNYSIDGERIVRWLGKDVKKYHRKLSTIINALEDNGFSITRVVEPIPTAEQIEQNKRMLTELHRPSYLMISAARRI